MEEEFVAILEENIDKLQNVMRFEHDKLGRICIGVHSEYSYEKDLSHSTVNCCSEIRKTIELLQVYKGINLTVESGKEVKPETEVYCFECQRVERLKEEIAYLERHQKKLLHLIDLMNLCKTNQRKE